MKRYLLMLCLSIFFLPAYSQKKKEEKEQVVEKIVQNDKTLELYWEKSMVDSLVNFYTSSCYYIPEGGDMLDSRKAVEKKIKNDFKSGLKVLRYTLTPAEHKVYGNLVIEVGTRTVKYIKSPSRAPVTKKYNYQFVWKKTSSGEYKIRTEMWNIPKD